MRNWVVAAYKEAGMTISADRGSHFMEVQALRCADRNINPVLLEAIEELIPYSQVAKQLKERALESTKPLSSLVFTPLDGTN